MTPLRAVNLLLAAATGAAIVLAVVLLLGVSRRRDFQVDEVENLHAAYNVRDGRMLYRDFWQSHPPLLYAMLVPLTDVHDPIATYQRGRVLLALVLLGTIGLIALCASRLGGAWAAALAAALALLHTTMVERGIEVRPDGPLALLIVAALAIELAPRLSALRRYSIQALLLGTGLLLTQKAILALAPFGVLWAVSAWRERRARLLVQPVVLAALPLLATWAVLGNTFFRDVYGDATAAAARDASRGTFGPAFFLARESARNLAFVLAAIAGLVALVRRRAIFPVALCAAGIAALWANPFPWPYVHLSFIPLFAVAAGCAVTLVPESWRGFVAALIIALAAMTSVPRLLQKANGSPELQFATLREVQRVTPPGARCFDLAGLYFRPDAYPVYVMSGDMLRAYMSGTYPRIVPELRRNGVDCVLLNYRSAALPVEERQFIASHFTHYSGNIYLPGADLSRGVALTFETLTTRAFRYDGNGAITVDGRPFVRGVLPAGVHRVDVLRPAAPARLIADAPPPTLHGPPVSLYTQFD